MAWPTNKPNSNLFDSDSDSIKASRPELKTMSDAVNDIVDFIDTSAIANDKILKYNSTSGQLEFVTESGGGSVSPLTQFLDTNGFGIGRGQDSAGANSPTMTFQYGDDVNDAEPGIELSSSGSGSTATADSLFVMGTRNMLGVAIESGYSTPTTWDGRGAPYRQMKLTDTYTGLYRRDTATNDVSQMYIGQGDIYIESGANSDIRITASGLDSGSSPGSLYLQELQWPATDGTSGQVLQTNGTGQLSWVTVSGGGGGTVDINAGTGISVTSSDSAGGYLISNTGMINLSDDATPELGGNLNLQNFDIISNSGVDIDIAPNNGDVNLKTANTLLGTGSATADLSTNGSHNLVLSTNNQTSSGTITINQGASANIEITPDGGGRVRINNAYNLPASDGSAGQVMTTDGFGGLSFTTVAGGGGGIQEVVGGTHITVSQPDSAGAVTITSDMEAGDNITFQADSAGEVSRISFQSPFTSAVDFNLELAVDPKLKGYREEIFTGNPTGGTITPNTRNGNVHSITLTGAITINQLDASNAAGDSLTLILKQPASGGPYTLTSTMKFAGGNKTLSTAADAIDILSIFYDGSVYYASLSTNFS